MLLRPQLCSLHAVTCRVRPEGMASCASGCAEPERASSSILLHGYVCSAFMEGFGQAFPQQVLTGECASSIADCEYMMCS